MFLADFVLVFVGGRIVFKAFGDFAADFVGKFVDINDLLLKKEAPGEVAALDVDEIDHEGALAGNGGVPKGVGGGPPIDGEFVEAAPVFVVAGIVELVVALRKITNSKVGILIARDFFQATFGQLARDGFVDGVAKLIGIDLERGEMLNAADESEGFVLGEVEVGIEVDVRFGVGYRGKESEQATEGEAQGQRTVMSQGGHDSSDSEVMIRHKRERANDGEGRATVTGH